MFLRLGSLQAQELIISVLVLIDLYRILYTPLSQQWLIKNFMVAGRFVGTVDATF
jgi:hypothetical protein